MQKIYTHFKKAPATHKLGVLYVVDTVTRQWLERARKAGQTIGSAAGDGTYAAGANRVTELLPVLMNDIIQHAPEDQKVRFELMDENPISQMVVLEPHSHTLSSLCKTVCKTEAPGVAVCLLDDNLRAPWVNLG